VLQITVIYRDKISRGN